MHELLAVVDDDPYFRRAVERTLGKVFEVRAFGLADDLLRAMAEGSCFAAVLFDLGLANGSGLSLLKSLRSQPPERGRPKIVIVTEHTDPLTVVAAMKHKPDAYLLKGDPAMPLLEAVKDALAGGLPLALPVTQVLIELVARDHPSSCTPAAAPPSPVPVVLSRRELEVLERLDQSRHANAAIARDLGMSQNTLATHISHIYDKLGVRNLPDPRFEALAKARRLGLLNALPARPPRLPFYVVGQ